MARIGDFKGVSEQLLRIADSLQEAKQTMDYSGVVSSAISLQNAINAFCQIVENTHGLPTEFHKIKKELRSIFFDLDIPLKSITPKAKK